MKNAIKTLLKITALSLVLAEFSFAQVQPPADLNVALMKWTFRIEEPREVGTGSGTAFVLARPFPGKKDEWYLVLITAAHVLEGLRGETAILRTRRMLSENEWAEVPTKLRIRYGQQPLWKRHPQADVAVMYVAFTLGFFQGFIPEVVPISMLGDDETLRKYEINPGVELNCLGYPLGFQSNSAGFPILRSGKIASYPLLPTSNTKQFLLDFRVFKGNSGGPAYFSQSKFRGRVQFGPPAEFLMGLVSQEVSGQQIIQELDEIRDRRYPLSLAIIVHASLIKETILLLPEPGSSEANPMVHQLQPLQ